MFIVSGHAVDSDGDDSRSFSGVCVCVVCECVCCVCSLVCVCACGSGGSLNSVSDMSVGILYVQALLPALIVTIYIFVHTRTRAHKNERQPRNSRDTVRVYGCIYTTHFPCVSRRGEKRAARIQQFGPCVICQPVMRTWERDGEGTWTPHMHMRMQPVPRWLPTV